MIIQGSDINPDALVGIKSLADLKKLDIFSHLTDSDTANEELWNVLKPGSKSKIPEPEAPEPTLTESRD